MVFDHGADLGHDRGHVDTTGLEVAAAWIEDRLHFLDQEGAVATLAEDRAHDARECHDPLEVVHVLRVDEDLEGPARLVRGALVEHDVVDGHVQRMLEQRRLDLVGRANQHVRALDALVHLDDLGHWQFQHLVALAVAGGRGRGRNLAGSGDAVALDLLANLDGHRVTPLRMPARCAPGSGSIRGCASGAPCVWWRCQRRKNRRAVRGDRAARRVLVTVLLPVNVWPS